MASQVKRRWVVKDVDGRVRGPYSTEKVIHKINNGDFSGEELIASYPGGHWIPISNEPEFYDRLLEILAGVERSIRDDEDESAERTNVEQKKSRVSETFEPVKPTSGTATERKSSVESNREKTRTQIEEPDLEKTPAPPRSERKKNPSQAEGSDVIELTDLRNEVKQEILQRIRGPITFGLIAVATLVWIFTGTVEKHQEERIHLLPLQKNRDQSSPEAAKIKIQQALPDFLRDTFGGYVRAENSLIQALQADPKNGELYALLCVTYNELWPFAYQDSQDLRTISSASQAAAQVDPGGQHSGVCRVVDLLVRGRLFEAKSYVNSVLENTSTTSSPPIIFYYLKALILESSGEIQTAIGYANSAQQLWPQWIRVYAFEAQLQSRKRNYVQAANIYNRVLKANPDHAVSRLELGLLEYREFHQTAKAEELLNAGLAKTGERSPQSLISRAYLGLAEIALAKQDRGKALTLAQKAYSMSSSNVAAKNLIVQLGGVEKLKATKMQGQHLIYEGDQFVREGDCQSAQAHYRAAYEEDKKNAMAALKAAKCLWNLSLSTEAIEWLNNAIKADPKMIEAYVLLADYYTQRYNFDAAARILASAQRIAPRSFEVFRGFALVELRRNNPNGSVGYAKHAIALYETDGDSYVILAKAYLAMSNKENYPLAYSAATKATEIDANNREAQIVYAEALAGVQGVEVGLEHLKKLVATYPLVVDYQIALGKLLMSDERYPQAEEVFRRIAKLDDKPKRALILLAKTLKSQSKTEEALEALLRAAVLDPADSEPLFQAALIYLENQQAQQARAQLERVLRINPAFPLVHYYMGRAALLAHQPEEALNQANEERKANPNLAEAYLLAAEAHTEMKQYSLCAGEYQKALRLIPQARASVYVKDARCYRLAGNYDVAASMLDVAYKREPGYAEIYKERGQLYEMQGDAQRAIEAYNQYFVLDPTAPDRAQVFQRLEALQRK